MRSTVIGHFHAAFGTFWYACDAMRIFGMSAGSLCDSTHLMQKYGKKYTKRPILGMGVVFQFMPDTRTNVWAREKALERLGN